MRIEPKSTTFTLLLGLFAALPVLSIDVSAPTLALLPTALDTTRTTAGLSLSLFMIGFAVGQLGGGKLSDRYGRRPVLLAGLACFTAAGVACALAFSGAALAGFRLVQGVGAGTCSVLSFAMVQDLFEGDEARAKRSYVAVIFGGVPILAPALGAELIDWLGWRSVHWTLALAGFVLFQITWACVPESRKAASVETSAVRGHAARLREDTGFVRILLANAFSYGAIFAYIAGSPVVVIGQLGFSTRVFAALFAATAAALTAGAWTSGRLARRGVCAAAVLSPSFAAAAVAAVALAAISLFGVTSGGILVPLLLAILFSRGMIAPNMQHLAIDRQRGRAGIASAAVGVTQLLSGALASAAVAVLLPVLGIGAVALPMALCAAAALAVWRSGGV